MSRRANSIGEALIGRLRERGVDTVFGIPGVHTVELYRGLAGSGVRHVTARHEQGAGFMADGYARASGRPGVALVITGPGLSNTLTAMAQARADSVPMLVISAVNRRDTLGRGLGHLHELPDQRGTAVDGGGARHAAGVLVALAERLDAPVVQTANARGLMYRHPLGVPASPSLAAVRGLIADADAVLAVGTELGPTDYDMYQDGGTPDLSRIVRIDVCAEQLARRPAAATLRGRAEALLPALLERLPATLPRRDGARRAEAVRRQLLAAPDKKTRAELALLETLREQIPGAFFVGDSTQLVYAGNLYYDHDRPGGWFNAATGYGALGYAIPAAVGAALAVPGAPVVCIAGDGGAQFTLAELLVAVDESLPVLFVVHNNYGYLEIAGAMAAAGVEVVGCDPTPPDFAHLAAACGMPYRRCAVDAAALADTLTAVDLRAGPALLELAEPRPPASARNLPVQTLD